MNFGFLIFNQLKIICESIECDGLCEYLNENIIKFSIVYSASDIEVKNYMRIAQREEFICKRK